MADKLPNVIELNVGGQRFTTRLATLTSDPDSMLAAMFSGRHLLDRDSQGRIFIDRDGSLFQHVLTFLRDGSLPPAAVHAAVLREAQYFQVRALLEALQMSPAKIAEDKVRADILSHFPKYDEVKRRLVSCAVEKASKYRCPVDAQVTLFVYDEVVKTKNGLSSVRFSKRTREFQNNSEKVFSWFLLSGVVSLDLSDLVLNISELENVNNRNVDDLMKGVCYYIVGDLRAKGFKVQCVDRRFFSYSQIWCSHDGKHYVLEGELSLVFTFLPSPLSSVT